MNYYKVKIYDAKGQSCKTYHCMAHCINCVKNRFSQEDFKPMFISINDYKPKNWFEKLKLILLVPPVEMTCDESVEIMGTHK